MVLRAEPGKQKPRSCRTQERARSSAQKMSGRKRDRSMNSAQIVGSASEKATEKRRTVPNHRAILLGGATRLGLRPTGTIGEIALFLAR
jgi:hypothetical protein